MRNTRRLVALWALTLAVVVAVLALRVAGALGEHTYWGTGLDAELAVAFTTLGLLILIRSEERRMGGLFLFIGCVAAFGLACGQLSLALHTHVIPAAVLYIASEFERYIVFTSLIYLLMVFPTGYVPGPRWRWPARLLAFAIVPMTAASAVFPGFDEMPGLINPIHASRGLSDALNNVGGIPLSIGILSSVAAVIVRYRRAQPAQRRQIKLFVLSAIFCVAFILVMNLAFPKQMDDGSLGDYVWDSPGVILPAAAAYAIIRHGLFDIERFISRTVSWGIITVLIGGMFTLVVLVPTAVIGSGHTPGWLVAAATLIAFGLFRPVRLRVQNGIDHRFNRKRYDAIRTVESFSARLRDEVDLQTLREELGRVIGETMQPAHVSLWIKQEEPTT